MKKKRYCKGNLVFVKHGNFGLATIENNGRKNTFNHAETIYKVKSVNSGKIDSFNELHFVNISSIPVEYGKENKAWAEIGYNH